jgi:hypothetical protein
MKKLRIAGAVCASSLVLAACGVGFGGRFNGGGSFEPSEEWAWALFNNLVTVATPWCGLIEEQIEEFECTDIFEPIFIGGPEAVSSGRLNLNFEHTTGETSTYVTPDTPDDDLPERFVANGHFSVKLDANGPGWGPSYVCDVTIDDDYFFEANLFNSTLANRIIPGTVSSAMNMPMEGGLIDGGDDNVDAIGLPCTLIIHGGSPAGTPGIYTAIFDQAEPLYAGGGFIEGGNMNMHRLNDKKVQRMCPEVDEN